MANLGNQSCLVGFKTELKRSNESDFIKAAKKSENAAWESKEISAHSANENSMKVRFSVLIPAYNREDYICQTVDSVLSQAFKDFEVIVVDDGSTDRTPQLLESYGTRIKAFRQQNQGAEAARNKAASLAQGEYLCMLDDDDLFLPGALATYDQIVRYCDSPPLIMGAIAFFKDGNPVPAFALRRTPIKLVKYPDFLSKDRSYFHTNSRIVMRKAVFDEIGGYGSRGEPTFPIDDLGFLFKAGTYGPCIVVQEPYSVVRRLHATNYIQNIGAIVEGILRLVRLEKQGRFPGGRHQRVGRYAVIGGFAWCWAYKHCWRRQKQRKLALRLFLGTAPMIAVAVWKRFLRCFRKPLPPIVLPEPESQAVCGVEEVSNIGVSMAKDIA